MPRPIPIGIDDFRKIRGQKLEYIDKSDLIRRLIDREGVEVVTFELCWATIREKIIDLYNEHRHVLDGG